MEFHFQLIRQNHENFALLNANKHLNQKNGIMKDINQIFEEIKEKLEKSKSLEEIKSKNLKYYREKYKGYTLVSKLN